MFLIDMICVYIIWKITIKSLDKFTCWFFSFFQYDRIQKLSQVLFVFCFFFLAKSTLPMPLEGNLLCFHTPYFIITYDLWGVHFSALVGCSAILQLQTAQPSQLCLQCQRVLCVIQPWALSEVWGLSTAECSFKAEQWQGLWSPSCLGKLNRDFICMT